MRLKWMQNDWIFVFFFSPFFGVGVIKNEANIYKNYMHPVILYTLEYIKWRRNKERQHIEKKFSNVWVGCAIFYQVQPTV